MDLAGFPKDVYYLYQSVWTEKPILHVLPHWNWKQGDRVDIVVYFNQADRVELYLNGKKIWEQSRDPDRYDLVFKAVEFEPGEIEVISFQGGKKLLSKTIRTAAKAHRIQLSSENLTFNSANKELSFVHAYIVDEFGTIVPDADDKIEFEVKGGGAKIVATDNGNTTDLTSFQSASRNAFHGKALAIVTSKNKGEIRVRAKGEGLISGVIQLEAN